MNRPLDPTFDQRLADWLEDDPSTAPREVLGTVLAAFPSIEQRRGSRMPWPWTSMRRIANAGTAAAAILAGVVGLALVVKPSAPAAGACPRTVSEAEAVDTTEPGLGRAQRAWGIAGGTPGSVRPGLIAAFAWDSVGGAPSVITIDPVIGARCRLVTFVDDKPIRENLDRLNWSPSGDAVAIGIENPPDQDGNSSGQVLVWAAGRLFRIWSGPGQVPGIEWAPDGRSIAVWTPLGAPARINARIVFADGSPDRVLGIQLSAGDSINWSPDGSRWIVGRTTNEFTTAARSTLAVIDLADGGITPIDIGIPWLSPKGWLDNERVRLFGGSDVGYVDLALAAPEAFSILALPADAPVGDDRHVFFSPDQRHVTYVNADGDRKIADITGEADGAAVQVPVGAGFSPGLAWAPDSSQLALVHAGSDASSDYATWIVDSDGSNLRQLLVGLVWPTSQSWQPVPVP